MYVSIPVPVPVDFMAVSPFTINRDSFLFIGEEILARTLLAPLLGLLLKFFFESTYMKLI